VLALVSSAEVLRLEAKLETKWCGESAVNPATGFGRLAVDAGAPALRATVGAGVRTLVTKQLKRVPAIEDGSELSLATAFTRGDAMGVIEGLSGAELGMFASARPSVKAKEPSAMGIPPKSVEAGSVDASAPADWTWMVSIDSSASDRGA
jgi:hypothetical protein